MRLRGDAVASAKRARFHTASNKSTKSSKADSLTSFEVIGVIVSVFVSPALVATAERAGSIQSLTAGDPSGPSRGVHVRAIHLPDPPSPPTAEPGQVPVFVLSDVRNSLTATAGRAWSHPPRSGWLGSAAASSSSFEQLGVWGGDLEEPDQDPLKRRICFFLCFSLGAFGFH